MFDSKKSIYTLRQVTQLTGITEFSLRGWESRYKAIQPDRTSTDRRLYCDQDIIRIKNLIDLTNRGHRIGQIAKLRTNELQKLLADQKTDAGLTSDKKNNFEDKEIQKIIQQVNQYNWDDVEILIHKLRLKMKPRKFIYDFILKLIAETNKLVSLQQFSISQEHILTSYIKSNLYQLTGFKKINKTSKIRMVIAAPEGDFHEIGILIASALASIHHVQFLYIGSNTPKADLVETCLRYKATHLLLSSTMINKTNTDSYLNYLNFIDQNLNSKIHFWLAGRNSEEKKFQLNRKYQVLDNFEQFEIQLKQEVK